jgi:FMN-dependent NADH-azoreductase
LRIDASARHEGSKSRAWADEIIDALGRTREVQLTRRDLSEPIPQLDQTTLRRFGYLSGEAEETVASELSERLIAELEDADAIVLATPIYNFSVPASLKAWIDLVARARRTFRYGDDGPRGLLADRPVYLVVASGGTRMHAEVDFATPYLQHVLGFLGLRDVRIVDACGADRTEVQIREEVGRAVAGSSVAA